MQAKAKGLKIFLETDAIKDNSSSVLKDKALKTDNRLRSSSLSDDTL